MECEVAVNRGAFYFVFASWGLGLGRTVRQLRVHAEESNSENVQHDTLVISHISGKAQVFFEVARTSKPVYPVGGAIQTQLLAEGLVGLRFHKCDDLIFGFIRIHRGHVDVVIVISGDRGELHAFTEIPFVGPDKAGGIQLLLVRRPVLANVLGECVIVRHDRVVVLEIDALDQESHFPGIRNQAECAQAVIRAFPIQQLLIGEFVVIKAITLAVVNADTQAPTVTGSQVADELSAQLALVTNTHHHGAIIFLKVRLVGDDADRTRRCVTSEQGALGTFHNFDSLDVKKRRRCIGAATGDHAINEDAHGRVSANARRL